MKPFFIISLIAGILSGTEAAAQDGQALFKQNCGACHSVGKGKLVGPDLKGSTTKFEKEWLHKWIKSSQSLVKENDPIAVKVFEENGSIPMPDQNLSKEEVEAVLTFIDNETAAPDAPPVAASEPVQNLQEAAPIKSGDSNTSTVTYAFALLSVLMLGVIVVLGNIIKQISLGSRSSAKDDQALM